VRLCWNGSRIAILKRSSFTDILVRCEFQYSGAAAEAHMHMVQLTGPHIPESDEAMAAMCTALNLAPIKTFTTNLFILMQLSPSSANQGLSLNLYRF